MLVSPSCVCVCVCVYVCVCVCVYVYMCAGVSGWVLPEHLQETTGVVYATSFPALDTAVEEVSRYFRSQVQSMQQQQQY